MNASISIIYYKFRTNKSGAHPLMLRIIKNRKTNYQSLGIYIQIIGILRKINLKKIAPMELLFKG